MVSSGSPRYLAVAPVAMMTVSAWIVFVSSIVTLCGWVEKSTDVTVPKRMSVSKRWACFLKSVIIWLPSIPSG